MKSQQQAESLDRIEPGAAPATGLMKIRASLIFATARESRLISHANSRYYKRAAEARRLAKATSDPEEKVDLFDVEQRWLSLAAMPLTKRI
jgi:hypothetical protein